MKAVVAAAFVAGGGTVLTASQLFGSAEAAATYTWQNEHTWVASLNKDGGVPTYAGRTCGYSKSAPDAGVRDVCGYDGAPLNPVQATAFEAYLKSLGVVAPR